MISVRKHRKYDEKIEKKKTPHKLTTVTQLLNILLKVPPDLCFYTYIHVYLEIYKGIIYGTHF